MSKPSRKTTLLNHEELRQIPLGEKLSVDYFYVPEFYWEEDDEGEDYLIPLQFKNKEGLKSNRLYASKVPVGMSLWDAVRDDLTKDFSYPTDKSFRIEAVGLLDTAKNKQGEDLSRVIIEVVVDEKFKTDALNPIGLKVYWDD